MKKNPKEIKLNDEPNTDLKPVYCSGCGRFLFYENIIDGMVRAKCRHCKIWTSIGVVKEELDKSTIRH